ncbi:MAG: YihY/virulence factor BrkB family protein [Chthoniobacterales bacterium]
MNLDAITGNFTYKLAKDTVNNWLEDNALRLSAALAYYSVFSIAPLLVIAISVAGLVLGPEAVRGQLDDQLSGYIGTVAAKAVQSMVQSAAKPSQSWIGAVTGFLTLLLGASGVFGQLKDALNTIWEVKPKSGFGVMGFIKERLLNFGMVLVIGFLLLTSLLLTTAITALTNFCNTILQLPPVIWGAISFVFSFGLVTVLFALIFKVLPDVQVKWRNVWIGAVVTAGLFELGKLGLAFYLGRESTASSYGAAGAVVLLLLWVYYTSCILFLGAEFTQVYAKATGDNIQPSPHAEPISAASRAQQGLTPPSVHETPKPEIRIISVPQPLGFKVENAVLLAAAIGLLAGFVTRSSDKQ